MRGDCYDEPPSKRRKQIAGQPHDLSPFKCNIAPEAPRYEFEQLIAESEELKQFSKRNENGSIRLDFSCRKTTAALTRAILKQHFNLRLSLSEGQLVPTVPNRVQYLQWASSLLCEQTAQSNVVMVDIGTGPSCIYAMLGSRLFPKWTFIATDTDPDAVQSARRNCTENQLRCIRVLQMEQDGELLSAEIQAARPSLTVCNPPFHAEVPVKENRAGTAAQLATVGGEKALIQKLAMESMRCVSVEWFTSLVGRKVDISGIVSFLRSDAVRALHVKTVELSPGGRTTRWAVAWSFGAATSTATLIRDDNTKWRWTVAIRPGRAFGNQLEDCDIISTIGFVMQKWEWTKEGNNAQSQQNGVVMRGPDGDQLWKTKVQFVVVSKPEYGEFQVIAKVVQRGIMQASLFADLGKRLTDAVVPFLDDAT